MVSHFIHFEATTFEKGIGLNWAVFSNFVELYRDIALR